VKKREIQNFLKIDTVQRGSPSGVSTYAAAYRAGESLWDGRTGNLYKYSWRKDVKHTEIVLPTKHRGNTALSWARDRSKLWNTVERSERRRDAKVAREYTAVLPSELTAAQRVSLARAFAQTIADRYQNVADVAIHEPRRGRAQNHHLHLLTTTREVTSDGLGAKTRIEGANVKSKTAYINTMRTEYREIHALWRHHLERALENTGIARGTYDLVFKKNRGIAAETSPKSWSEFNAGSFLQRTLIRLTQRQDRKATRHTPSERESVKRRKEAIRSSREAELKRRRERISQRQREYLQRNRGRISQQKRKYYQRNRERVKQTRQKYRQRNRTRINERQREYYRQNRERNIQRRRKYVERNRGRVNQRQHEYNQRNGERINQRKREYLQRNRERVNQARREYRRRNRTRINERQREYRQRNRARINEQRRVRRTRASQRERIVETPQVRADAGASVSPEKIQRQAANEWLAYRKEEKGKDNDNGRDKEMKKVKDRGLEL